MGYETNTPTTAAADAPAISDRRLDGIFGKKELYFFLFPSARRAQTQILKRVLPGIVHRLKLTHEQYDRIRQFNAEQCGVILRELRRNNLHP